MTQSESTHNTKPRAERVGIGNRTAAIIRVWGVWIALLVLFVVSGLISPSSVKVRQLLNVLQVTAFLGVGTIGQTVVVLTGGIDLSIAGMMTAVNFLASALMAGQPERIWIAVVASIALGAVMGLANGLLIVRVRITPLITTLSTNGILFGAALISTGGVHSGAVPDEFTVFGMGSLAGFPISALIWLILVFVAWVLLRKTIYGRWLYAVGANPRCAAMTGVQTDRMIISAYVFSGVMAAIAGLLVTSYIKVPAMNVGAPYQLSTVAATVVGGTSLVGGIGSVLATAAGALFITQLNSLTNILRITTGVQFIIMGLIIGLGVALHSIMAVKRN